MELLWTTELWRSRLLAYSILFVHPALPSAICSATMESICLFLPSVRDQSTCEPWANVLLEGYEATLVDLRTAYDVVVVRRKEARDTSER